MGLPGFRAFAFEVLDQEVDEGAEFWLGIEARWVDHVDAKLFDGQFGQDRFQAAIFQSLVIQEAGQVGDAKARFGGLQQGLAVVHGQ